MKQQEHKRMKQVLVSSVLVVTGGLAGYASCGSTTSAVHRTRSICL